MGIQRPVIYFLCSPISFPSTSASSTRSSNSTRSDAESAPPELDLLFNKICDKCEELVLLSNRQVPTEWNMADLIRAVMGKETTLFKYQAIYKIPIMMFFYGGATSWLFEDLGNFIDLIHYAL